MFLNRSSFQLFSLHDAAGLLFYSSLDVLFICAQFAESDRGTQRFKPVDEDDYTVVTYQKHHHAWYKVRRIM